MPRRQDAAFPRRPPPGADLPPHRVPCRPGPHLRCLIADPSFLRRYRSFHRHQPLLLGFLGHGTGGLLPADAPHPNAPVARALARAADFSFHYLPRREQRCWEFRDACDGRVLLQYGAADLVFPDLAVCDPLSRGYLLLPPIPEDLVASVVDEVQAIHSDSFDAFLVPSADYEETRFRVIGWAYCSAKAVVLVYSSVSGHWTVGTSTSWDALGLTDVVPDEIPLEWWPSYAYGCFYWKVPSSYKLLKLDVNRMEVSAVDILPGHGYQDVVVVGEVGEGRLGVFSHTRNPPLCYTINQNDGENANDLPMRTTIPLPCQYCRVAGAAEGYIFLVGSGNGDPMVFSLELRTLKIERVCSSWAISHYITPYFGFPPFMSPRRI